MSHASLPLQPALEAVYEAFAAPPPERIDGCPCCIGKRKVDVLITKPLRELTGQELWSYVSGVFFTVGDERDFKYLLPRIFDISIHDRGNANGPEIELGKLKLANWHTWPARQRDTVTALVDAWFDQELAADLDDAAEIGMFFGATESLLCGAARAGVVIPTRWIARLREPEAAPVLDELQVLLAGRPKGFWEDVPEQFAELRTLLAVA